MKVILKNKTTNDIVHRFNISKDDIIIYNADYNQSIQIKVTKNIFDVLTKANYSTFFKNTQTMFPGNMPKDEIKRIQETTNDYFLCFQIPNMDDDMRDRFYDWIGIPYINKELQKVKDLDCEFKTNNTDLIIDGNTIDISKSIINEIMTYKN